MRRLDIILGCLTFALWAPAANSDVAGDAVNQSPVAGVAGVASFNERAGAIVLLASDINSALGITTLSETTGSYTLLQAEYSNPTLIFTGTLTGNVTFVVPNNGVWNLLNQSTGAFTITVKTASGTGVTVPQFSGAGATTVVANGASVVYANTAFGNIQLNGDIFTTNAVTFAASGTVTEVNGFNTSTAVANTTGAVVGVNCYNVATGSGAGGVAAHIVGCKGEANYSGSGSLDHIIGSEGAVEMTGSGALVGAYANDAYFEGNTGAGVALTNLYMNHIGFNPVNNGTITNVYAYDMPDMSSLPNVTNRYFLTNEDAGAQSWTAAGMTFGGTTVPDASAVVDMRGTTKGLAPPRMTSTQRAAIGSPVEGLVVYDTTLHTLMEWNAVAWTAVTPQGNTYGNYVLLTSGTSWTVPAGVQAAKVCLQGGGGAGGSVAAGVAVAAGGVPGNLVCALLTALTPGASMTYAIAAGGVPGATGNNPGGTGGGTQFTYGATTLIAKGGLGGTGSTTGNAAAQAAISIYIQATATPIIPTAAMTVESATYPQANGGGAAGGGGLPSPWGIGGVAVTNSAGNAPASGYGGSGSGAASTGASAFAGGAGAPGAIAIWY
jgi:hypothetical protein